MTKEKKQKSFLNLKYPSLRDEGLRTAYQWLRGKSMDDGAEGYWRIHDKLYDLTDYVKHHPGGRDWLKYTKNSDITEAFETHHLSDKVYEVAERYYLKEANSPRNHPFTFHEDGFYKTLKVEIKAKLANLSSAQRNKSKHIFNYLIAALIITTATLCWLVRNEVAYAVTFAILPGYILSCVTAAAHNFLHQKDNWQMFLFNLSGMSYREWRISHAMSHHLHTNTAYDLELVTSEPLLHFLPNPNKSTVDQLKTFYLLLLYPIVFLSNTVKEIISFLFKLEDWTDLFHPADILFFALPVWMYLAGGTTLTTTLALWITVLSIGSFIFIYCGLTAGHHNENNFFEGDYPRSQNLDWGEHQLDTIVETMQLTPETSLFTSITSFGDHTLHHLFPTVDHAYLKELQPTFLEHCHKYNKVFRTTSHLQSFFSKFRQLLRKEYNDFQIAN